MKLKSCDRKCGRIIPEMSQKHLDHHYLLFLIQLHHNQTVIRDSYDQWAIIIIGCLYQQ